MMRVGKLKEMLKAYSDDTELLVEYWDKETLDSYMFDPDEGDALTVDQWNEVVRRAESRAGIEQAHILSDIGYEVINEN